MGGRRQDEGSHGDPQGALLRVLADKIPAMLAYWDAGLRCRYANRAYEAWFGVTAESMIGRNLEEFLGRSLYEANRPHIEAALRGEEQQFEREIPNPAGGPPRHSLAHYIPDIVDGTVRGFCVLVADISDRRKAEEALLVMQRRSYANERLAAMATLAAGIAHEINNPLASVLGNIELALGELEATPVSMSALGATLVQALENGRRVSDIVQSMNLLARGDTARHELVDVTAIIDQSVALVSNVVRYRAKLVRDVEEVGYVEANATQLAHVFVGLLMNAAQALPEANVEQNEIHLTARRSDGEVTVEVRDNGSGIPDAVLSRIFEPFFTTRDVGGGVGLGLAVSYAVVSALGGQLSVTSKVGEGSVFRVCLPAAATTVARPPAQASVPPERPSSPLAVPTPTSLPSLLIIDDDKALAHTLVRMFDRSYAVTVANGGREAISVLSAATEHPPSFDVILCDLMMPEVTGADVYEEVTRLRPELASRFVFMTGGAFTPRGQQFLEACGAPVATKPFDLKRLRATVAEVALAKRS